MATESLRLVLLAGIPGVGKTTIAKFLRQSVVVSSDDFYKAIDDPNLPKRHGLPDWEVVQALDLEQLRFTVEALLKGQVVLVPSYDMHLSRPSGQRPVDPTHVVTRLVEPAVVGLGAGTGQQAAVIALQQAHEAAGHDQLQVAE